MRQICSNALHGLGAECFNAGGFNCVKYGAGRGVARPVKGMDGIIVMAQPQALDAKRLRRKIACSSGTHLELLFSLLTICSFSFIMDQHPENT